MIHGATGYKSGCRCEDCRKAQAAAQSQYWHRQSPEQREARREYMRQYMADPRRALSQRVRLRMRKRRHQGKSELDGIPEGLIDHLLALMELGTCAYCGCTDRKLEIEHIDTRGPTTIENTTVACRSCNFRKYDGGPDELDVPRHLKRHRRSGAVRSDGLPCSPSDRTLNEELP